jgi:succinylglutamic semialdehyde dehydrogenase
MCGDMSDTEIISIEPATGAVLWRSAISDVDFEVAEARKSWAEWGSRSVAVRTEILKRFATLTRSKADDFATCIARETGKPMWEARNEVDSVINKVDISVMAYQERTGQRRIEGNLGVKTALRHKPHGVMAVLGPYNFPAHLPNGHIIPALLAGNAVVFKPSEKTPATGKMLVDLLHASGVPSSVLRLVIGGPDAGKRLAGHDGIDGILFTGSSRAGIAIHRLHADNPGKIVALEMGGNNPIVVWDAADIPSAAVLVAQSAFLSAGQRCSNARRLIVRDGAHEQLVEELGRLMDRLIVGAPNDSPPPFMGPVIDLDAADALQEAFLNLMMKGGQPIKQLTRPKGDLPFLSPALIDVTNVSERIDAELFGPILQMVRVPDFDAAIREANNTRYGLSAALVGGTPAMYDRFWANIRAGVVNWNKPTNGASSSAPFGGVGLSGNHRPSAFYAADYCAYPVASSEEENARAFIGIGLKDFAPSFAK